MPFWSHFSDTLEVFVKRRLTLWPVDIPALTLACRYSRTSPQDAADPAIRHLSTPELIHAPERIGILAFKRVPQGQRGQFTFFRMRRLERPQWFLIVHFKPEEPELESFQGFPDLRQREMVLLNVEEQIPAFAQAVEVR